MFGGNTAARHGVTADVPGAVGAAVVVGGVGVPVTGVVDSLGAGCWRTTIRCGVGGIGTWAGAVVTGWIEVGRTEVTDVDWGGVDGGDGGDVSGGQGGGGRQMIGGSGPIGSRQIGGNGQCVHSGAETASRVTINTASGATGGIVTELRSVEEASAIG